MSGPTLLTRVLLVAALIALATVGVVFYVRQNHPTRAGGPISRPKMLWLTYVVGLWFFVCPIVARDHTVAVPLRAACRFRWGRASRSDRFDI